MHHSKLVQKFKFFITIYTYLLYTFNDEHIAFLDVKFNKTGNSQTKIREHKYMITEEHCSLYMFFRTILGIIKCG